MMTDLCSVRRNTIIIIAKSKEYGTTMYLYRNINRLQNLIGLRLHLHFYIFVFQFRFLSNLSLYFNEKYELSLHPPRCVCEREVIMNKSMIYRRIGFDYRICYINSIN